jgi:hypothetical protein
VSVRTVNISVSRRRSAASVVLRPKRGNKSAKKRPRNEPSRRAKRLRDARKRRGSWSRLRMRS